MQCFMVVFCRKAIARLILVGIWGNLFVGSLDLAHAGRTPQKSRIRKIYFCDFQNEKCSENAPYAQFLKKLALIF